MNKIYDRLNEAQLEAVTHSEGPLLIMAGAGSGKTRVLTCRIAHLLEQGVEPWRILAITFTNKAAAEMKERVAKLVGASAKRIWISTFHSFCAKFLRYEIESLSGYKKNFVIYDSGDSQAVIKACLKELNLDDKQYVPNAIQSAISNAKNALQTAGEYAQLAGGFYEQKVAEIYTLYQQKLKENNALDFDDLLLLTVKLLDQNDAVREKYSEQFRYIMIDEYQDTNRAQYLLAQLLAQKHGNLCVVGDADQSIYAWRGADIRNILDFQSDYADAKVIKLEENYRSKRNILDAANAVIEHNSSRLPKLLKTRQEPGEKISCYLAGHERDEAQFIADTLLGQHTLYHIPYGDMAVLYRTNAQSRVIEEALMRAGIPYTMVGGLKFYDRKEIKDVLAYLKVLFNPADSLALLRIVNVPKRGLGNTSIERVTDYAAEQGINLFDVISNPDQVPKLTSKAKHQFENLSTLLFDLMGKAATLKADDLIEQILDKSGYLAELEAEKTPQADARIENLKELLSVAKDFPELENFLEQVALVSDIDSADLEEDRAILMTLHAAKGLEFRVAVLAGLEEGIFPHARTLASDEEVEEERRICYVGITRAKEKLFLTYARNRTIFGRTQASAPSRFLDEIPKELLQIEESEQLLYGSWQSSSSYRPQRPVHSTQVTNSFVPKKPAMNPVKQASKPVTKPLSPLRQAGQTASYQVGEKVHHKTYGSGTIVSVKGTGEEQEISIAFPGAGVKPFMAKYAPLRKI